MTDPTPTPEPTPAAKTRTQGVLNKKQQKSIALAEQVSTAAAKDEYSSILETDHEIAPAFVAQLAADCATARGNVGQVIEKTVAKTAATGGKAGSKQALIQAIRGVQAAARQKYLPDQPLMLKEYYVGEKIAANQDTLGQIGIAILDKLSPPEGSTTVADVLPGIKAAKISALSNAVANYTSSWGAQASAQSDKVKGRIALNALVRTIDDHRRLIQFAVDGEWTFDNPANAPIRREFGLPASRPFVAVVKSGQTQTIASPALPAAVKRKAAPKAAKAKAKKAVKTMEKRKK